MDEKLAKLDRDRAASWLGGAARDLGNVARRLESGSQQAIKASTVSWVLSGLSEAGGKILINRETEELMEAP